MNLFAVVPAALRVLQAGRALSHPAAWKQVQNIINLLTALAAVAAALGYTVPIPAEGIALVAGGVVALVNVYLTVATTDKIGLGTPKNDDLPPQLPPIELAGQATVAPLADQGRAVAGDAGLGVGAVQSVDLVRQRESLPASDRPGPVGSDDTYPNLAPPGFGDRG